MTLGYTHVDDPCMVICKLLSDLHVLKLSLRNLYAVEPFNTLYEGFEARGKVRIP